MKTSSITTAFIIVLIVTVLSSCTAKTEKIQGSWDSVSIVNPDPLFKKTLPDNKPGAVKVQFNSDSTYTWQREDGKKLSGVFYFENDLLCLKNFKENGTVKLKYETSGNRLVLVTDDRFTFTFAKQK